jgi:hypothetical protein
VNYWVKARNAYGEGHFGGPDSGYRGPGALQARGRRSGVDRVGLLERETTGDSAMVLLVCGVLLMRTRRTIVAETKSRG